MEQISVQIQRAVARGADKINIKLHPAHLGRIEVRLDIAPEGQLSAIIMAEKPETLELLQRDIRGLEKALQQAGLETNSHNFDFGLKQKNGQSRDSNLEDQNNKETVLEEQNDEDDKQNSITHYSFGQNRSTTGGIDIHI